MKRVLQGLIKAYAVLLSPVLGQNCRFHPTCSAYAYEAIGRHGAVRGTFLALRRIVKCHPFYKGPIIDPVPDKPSLD